jgi:geranylgeranyl diphosphate synthase, type II
LEIASLPGLPTREPCLPGPRWWILADVDTRRSKGTATSGQDRDLIEGILAEALALVQQEISVVTALNRRTGYGPLYDLVEDYPFREGKGLRPAICIAAARSAGGHLDQVQPSATALELLHNAFLVHDDIEDASELRRGVITMLKQQGAAVAVNVGDATLVLALQLLLQNVSRIGVHKALLVLSEVERMARESAEGQAIELDWIRGGEFDLSDHDYIRMVHKKTCWYTVIAPLRIGVICGHDAGADFPLDEELLALTELGHLAGVAFQISDDLLNLEADADLYGKESAGDLCEGKRTVMLLHYLRTATPSCRRRAVRLLRMPRVLKSPSEVAWLYSAMRRAGSLEHARGLALDYSNRALEIDARPQPYLTDGDDRRFLRGMLRYVVERVK